MHFLVNLLVIRLGVEAVRAPILNVLVLVAREQHAALEFVGMDVFEDLLGLVQGQGEDFVVSLVLILRWELICCNFCIVILHFLIISFVIKITNSISFSNQEISHFQS